MGGVWDLWISETTEMRPANMGTEGEGYCIAQNIYDSIYETCTSQKLKRHLENEQGFTTSVVLQRCMRLMFPFDSQLWKLGAWLMP